MDSETRLALSKLELSPGDLILIRGDVPEDLPGEIAEATKHFVVHLPDDVTMESIPKEQFREMIDTLIAHDAAGGQ